MRFLFPERDTHPKPPNYKAHTHCLGLASATSAQVTHQHKVCACFECKCVRVSAKSHDYEAGWTAKINKYDRVEQSEGKSPTHRGHPQSFIVFLFKFPTRPYQPGGAEREQGAAPRRGGGLITTSRPEEWSWDEHTNIFN